MAGVQIIEPAPAMRDLRMTLAPMVLLGGVQRR
jgi:hypothetical protein